jgi:hypothetical protein
MNFQWNNLYVVWLLFSLVWLAFVSQHYEITDSTNALFLIVPPVLFLIAALGVTLFWHHWLRSKIMRWHKQRRTHNNNLPA